MKTFACNEIVEVQREPSAEWEYAKYKGKSEGAGSGHHIVTLMPQSPKRVVTVHHTRIETHVCIVPSRRIRKVAR